MLVLLLLVVISVFASDYATARISHSSLDFLHSPSSPGLLSIENQATNCLRIEYADGSTVAEKLKNAIDKAIVTQIDIAFCDLSYRELQRIGRLLQNYTNLESFSLTDMSLITSPASVPVTSSLLSLTGEVNVDKEKSNTMLQPLIHNLRRLPHLRHISFSGCNLDDAQVESLGFLFGTTTTALSKNNKRKKRQQVDDSTSISPSSSSSLTSPLHPCIESLDLSRNKLTSRTMRNLAQSWSQAFQYLHTLDFSYNSNLGSVGLHVLVSSLKDFPLRYGRLRKLYLRQIGAYTGAMTHLLDALSASSTTTNTTPIMNSNGPANDSTIPLVQQIEVLDLSGNYLMTARDQRKHEEQRKSQSVRWMNHGQSWLLTGQKQVLSALEQVASNVGGSSFTNEGAVSNLLPYLGTGVKKKSYNIRNSQQERRRQLLTKKASKKKSSTAELLSDSLVLPSKKENKPGKRITGMATKSVANPSPRYGKTNRRRSKKSQLDNEHTHDISELRIPLEVQFVQSLSNFLKQAVSLRQLSLVKTQLNDRFFAAIFDFFAKREKQIEIREDETVKYPEEDEDSSALEGEVNKNVSNATANVLSLQLNPSLSWSKKMKFLQYLSSW